MPITRQRKQLDADPTHYKVLSGGISTASGARYQGEIVPAEEIGDAARIAKLLERKSIEAALADDDAAD